MTRSEDDRNKRQGSVSNGRWHDCIDICRKGVCLDDDDYHANCIKLSCLSGIFQVHSVEIQSHRDFGVFLGGGEQINGTIICGESSLRWELSHFPPWIFNNHSTSFTKEQTRFTV
jgi:hypothetical protein